MQIDLSKLTIQKIKASYLNGEFSARELVNSFHVEIKKKNSEMNAYRKVFDNAFEKAEEIDLKIKHGDSLRELEGIPIAVKDNICVKDEDGFSAVQNTSRNNCFGVVMQQAGLLSNIK